MSVDNSVAIVLAAFEAVERRDQQRLRELYHPEAEFHWPASLPFGGSSRGGSGLRWLTKAVNPGGRWDPVWSPDGSELRYTAERSACSPGAAGSARAPWRAGTRRRCAARRR